MTHGLISQESPWRLASGKDLLNHWQSMRELVDTPSVCSGRRIVHLD